MEIVEYLLIFISCTWLKKAKAVAGNIVGELIESVAGGAGEEFMESVVQRVFPDGTFFFTNKFKARKKLFRELIDYINELNSKQKDQLAEFIDRLDYTRMSKKMSKKFNRMLELSEGDILGWLNRIDVMTDSEADEMIRTFKKAIDKVLDEVAKQTDDAQNKSLNVKKEDICLDLLGVELDKTPKAVRGLLDLIHNQVYELKYLRMSSKDQDMIKIIQHMIEEGNDNLIKTLKPAFNYMEQICEQTGKSFSEIKIDHIAKTDPFCYFRLECPACQATGRNVYKDSDNNVHCLSCGETFSIIESVKDDEIKEKFEAVLREIRHVGNDIGEKHIKEMKMLAGKIVGVEYFEAFKRDINNQQQEIVYSVNDLLKKSENNINKRLDKILNELRNGKNNDDISSAELLKKVTDAIRSLDQENKKLLLDMYESVKQTHSEVGEVKVMVTKIVNQMDSIDQLTNALDYLNAVRVTPTNEVDFVISEIAVCPRCGRSTDFKRMSGEEHYVCTCCQFAVEKNSFSRITTIPVDDPKLEIRFDGSKRLQTYHIKKCSCEDTVCICLNSQDANLLNNGQQLYRVDGSNYHPKRLIVCGDLGMVKLNEEAVRKLYNLYPLDLREIVFGDNITVDSSVWFLELSFGHHWDYNESLNKLCKSN